MGKPDLIPAEWHRELCGWARKNESVRELWLFGSRAKGTSRPDSDVDLALVLIPPKGKHDWALGNYVALQSDWKCELEAIVGRHVSLEAIVPGTPGFLLVRAAGKLLWSR